MALITTILQDTRLNKPAAGSVGRLFVETDTRTLFWDSGTEWLPLEGREKEEYLLLIIAILLA